MRIVAYNVLFEPPLAEYFTLGCNSHVYTGFGQLFLLQVLSSRLCQHQLRHSHTPRALMTDGHIPTTSLRNVKLKMAQQIHDIEQNFTKNYHKAAAIQKNKSTFQSADKGSRQAGTICD